MSQVEQKPTVAQPTKSSMEILSELFSTFDAEPPLIIKKEKDESKKHKKSKKKHKHKEKKHKKKDKKRKRSDSSSSEHSEVDLAKLLIKQERQSPEKKIKVEDTHLIEDLLVKIKSEETDTNNSKENLSNSSTKCEKDKSNEEKSKETSYGKSKTSSKSKITIKNLKFSSIFEATIREVQEKEKKEHTEEGELSLSEESTDEDNSEKKERHKRKHKHSHDERSKRKKHSHRSHSKENGDKHIKSSTKKVDRKKSPIRFPKDCDEHKSKHDHKIREKSDYCKSSDKYKDEYKLKDRHKDDYYKIKDECKSKYKNGYYKEKEKDDYYKEKEKDGYYKEKEKDSYYKEKEKDSYYKEKDSYYKEKEKDSYYKEKEKESDSRNKNHEDHKHCKYRENSFYKEEGCYKTKEDVSHERECDEKWFMKDRYRGYSEQDRDRERRYRERSTSRDHIDKKKLLEIARKNAIQMMKSGSLPAALTLGPQAQEKVLAAIKAGGKTIEELTDFCKTLSKKEELGELSSVSGDEDGDDSDPENKAFHHPFQIKDRPTAIVMNIKNSVPLPTKTAQERTAELRMQFPVSSGTQHRKTENEWVPVSPKKIEALPVPSIVKSPPPAISPAPPLPIEAPPLTPAPQPPIAPPGPQVFPAGTDPNIDIGSIVSQRLQAMRKLQENPYDVEALNEMHKSQREMQTWAASKQQPGQFTGSTGASILTQAELAAGYQAWARKDQLQNAAPVSGGMGMHLLKKMGWNPGEGLGKEKTGALEPLLLEVKLDKKGLVANEEQRRRQQKAQKNPVKTLEGKHPVSLLGEYTAKRKLGAPQYTLCMESGPDHKKMFLFKVIVNGIEYQPDTASPNKKQAKADAARLCLQQMGLLLS